MKSLFAQQSATLSARGQNRNADINPSEDAYMKSSSKAVLPSNLAKQLSARKRKPVRITSNSRSPHQAKVNSYGALPLPYEVQRELLSPVKTNRNSNPVRLEPVTSERKSLVCERILQNLSGKPQPQEPYMKKTNKCLFPDA